MHTSNIFKNNKLIFIVALVGSALFSLNVAMADYINTPSAYWKLEEATSSPPFIDHVGDNDGTCTVCPTQNDTDGIAGYYQSFDQTGDRIFVAASGNPTPDAVFDWGATDSFTIELWVRRAAGDIADSNEVLVGRDEGSTAVTAPTGVHWWVGLRGIGANEGKVVFALFDKDDQGSGPSWVISDRPVNDGKWHHIVAVRDNTSGRNLLYVDGVLQQDYTDVAYNVGFDSVDSNLNIGYLFIDGVPEYLFLGDIDEIALYDDALSANDANQHSANGRAGQFLDVAFTPVIVSTAVDSVAVGYDYGYDVDAGANPAPTSYALSGQPSGMTIDSSGVIEWKPNDRQVADYSFSVTATNQDDTSAPQNITAGVYDLCNAGDIMSAYWKLEEETASPPFVDYMGTSDGTCTVCPTQNDTDGIAGYYQSFDGTGDRIFVAASGNPTPDTVFDWGATDSFTIELWVRRAAGDIADSNEVLVGRDEGSTAVTAPTGVHWWVGLRGQGANEGKVVFALFDKDDQGSGPSWVIGDRPINDGEWHHIVAVRNDTAGRNLLYVDSVLQQDYTDVAYNVGFDSVDSNLNIGYLFINGSPEYFFQGDLDEIALYDMALSSGIVGQHYAQISDRGYCNAKPVITSDITVDPGITATENQMFNYTATATDAENDAPLTWSLEGAPQGMTVTPATGDSVTVAWTPSNENPSGTVTLVVDDGYGGTSTEVFTVTVTTGVNDSPEITTTAGTSATVGTPYTYLPSATDEEGDDLTWSLTAAPDGMTINATSGAIAWTPGAGVTTSGTVTLRVSDGGGGFDTQTFTITVNDSNTAPEITTTAGTAATSGSAYNYNPAATDADDDTLTWALTDAPDGMTIDTATGAITWTPASGMNTSGAVTLTVSDGQGGSDSEEFTITVSEPGDEPEADSGGGGGSGCFIGSIK